MNDRQDLREEPSSLAKPLRKQLDELSADPGDPDLGALTQFISAVHVRLFGVAIDTSRPSAERCGAVTQLGREARAAGADDPKAVRPHVLELLQALRARVAHEEGEDATQLTETIDRAVEACGAA